MAIASQGLLDRFLPSGSQRYIGLLTTLPAADGTGGVEPAGGGYGRAGNAGWIDETIGGTVFRKNSGTPDLPTLTAGIDGVVGFGIYDAPTGGSLLAFGPILDSGGNVTRKNLRPGEIPRFIDQDLKVGGTYGFAQTWFEYAPPENNSWQSLCWASGIGLWVAVSGDGTHRVMTSPDGRAWTPQTAPSKVWSSVAWSPTLGLLAAVSVDGFLMTSPDGRTWTIRTIPEANAWTAIAWSVAFSRFVAVGRTGTNRVMVSTNGTTWVAHAAAEANQWSAVVSADGINLLVATSLDGTHRVMTSSDGGSTWTPRTAAEANSWVSIAWSPALGLLAAIAPVGTHQIMTSTNGTSWTPVTAPAVQNWTSIVWATGRQSFYVVENSGAAVEMTSTNGSAWSSAPISTGANWSCVAWSDDNAQLCIIDADGFSVLTLDPVIAGYAQIDAVDETALATRQALMPPGVAWPRDADAELVQLERAIAYEFARIRRRVKDFADELDPRTTFEMLADHERVWGLPGKCVQPSTIEGRRAALQGKMNGAVDPSNPNATSIAAALGYAISITEIKHTQMFTSISKCNATLYTRQWMFLWKVTTPHGSQDAVLKCVLEDFAQLHWVVQVVFT